MAEHEPSLDALMRAPRTLAQSVPKVSSMVIHSYICYSD